MEAYIFDWLNLLLRWLHVITAIAWIGSSFYFVWLDNSLLPPEDPALKAKGVGGELWAVHGGGFYNPQKYLLAPKKLPAHLHWFFWEAYSTWLSGFALFSVLYLFNAKTFLVDPGVMPMAASTAVAAALGFLAAGWLLYDAVCRVFGDRRHGDRIVGVLLVVLVAAGAWLACHLFAGRAAFLLMGATLATIMSGNVFFWIIPGQRKMVASMRAGNAPDPIHGKRGKQRSVHNTYFTLPVLFAMLSNHYSMTYAAPHNWVVLLAIMLAGVLVRQFFVLRHKGIFKPGYPIAAVVVLVAVAVWIAPQPPAATAAPAQGEVSFATVQAIIAGHCLQCHAAKPSMMPVPGKGVVLEDKAAILQHAQMIYQQVVVQKSMPLGNLTHLSDEDRRVLGEWYEAGAKGE
ncbi:urate hydroxylase PuuD [Herbaspirillum sp. RTI4]|uniref:urate hydroxylase PuuD n=1 Tax=Herbaspirillum sp. RTI4 TaxID=3048640 RepID=UPI002AB3749E|nr:urate hydroxylase PuuD [Herbaspirillum sp. RTI4]MDY7576895.1 urate hydroxylase PuuD [Herbaspirillum sp. RTI4]MEA9982499.1 urate hydroxylase PuuD [Herbaspirillum sp. RTI4]